MSKTSKTRARSTSRKHQSHAKTSGTAKPVKRRVAATSRKPHAAAKRARNPTVAADELPEFVLITEERFLEAPDNDFDDDDDNEELGE